MAQTKNKGLRPRVFLWRWRCAGCGFLLLLLLPGEGDCRGTAEEVTRNLGTSLEESPYGNATSLTAILRHSRPMCFLLGQQRQRDGCMEDQRHRTSWAGRSFGGPRTWRTHATDHAEMACPDSTWELHLAPYWHPSRRICNLLEGSIQERKSMIFTMHSASVDLQGG